MNPLFDNKCKIIASGLYNPDFMTFPSKPEICQKVKQKFKNLYVQHLNPHNPKGEMMLDQWILKNFKAIVPSNKPQLT